jgi:hypothetical protein
VLALVHLVVDVLDQAGGDAGERLVPAGALLGRAGDDQRGPGLVDQDRVDLVHDRERVPALDQLVGAERHVVAQVVEAELVVRAVRDVGGVVGPALPRGHRGQDRADVEAEEAVDDAHPLGVALGQVVVGGDDVHAAAREGVQVGGQGPGQRLALAGAHLGDLAEVHGRAAHELDVEVALAPDPAGTLPDRGERLRHQVVEILTVGHPLAVDVGELAQLGVAALAHLVLEVVGRTDHGLTLAQQLALAHAEDLGQNHDVEPPGMTCPGRPARAGCGHGCGRRRRRYQLGAGSSPAPLDCG